MKKILLLLSFLVFSASAFAQSVTPVINYVTNYGNGIYGVTYGYNSTYETTQNFPVSTTGNKNYFNPNPANRNQPTTFLPGVNNEVWTLYVSYGSTARWYLTTKDITHNTKNISVTQEDDRTTMPDVGSLIEYKLDYYNSENTNLSSAFLIDSIPAGTSFVSATNGGTYSNGVVKWNLGTFAKNSSGYAYITLQVTSSLPLYKNKLYLTGVMSTYNRRAYCADENTPSLARTTDSSYIAAFEDLKGSGWNDWDVNDFVVGMRERVTFNNSNAITKIVFDYEALARGSAFVNKFKQLVKLTGNSTATLVVKDSNGTVLPALGFTNQAFTGNIDVPIFPNTYNALPPRTGAFTNTEISQVGVVKGYTATLTITADGSSNTASTYLRNSAQPYLINELNKQINISSLAGTLGNTQNVDNNGNQSATLYGYFLDLGYRLPYDWKWPLENVAIWNSFPQFDDFILSSQTTNTAWYNSPDLSKVWTRRVVTDNFAFTGETTRRSYTEGTPKSEVTQTKAPEKHVLSQNYPNPFNPTTKISFSVPQNEFVTVKIFDMTGKVVAELVSKEMNAGTYEYQFDGSTLSSGMYFYRITTPSFSDTKRMTLVK